MIACVQICFVSTSSFSIGMLALETQWQHPVAWPWQMSNRRSLFHVQPSDRRRPWVTAMAILSYAASFLVNDVCLIVLALLILLMSVCNPVIDMIMHVHLCRNHWWGQLKYSQLRSFPPLIVCPAQVNWADLQRLCVLLQRSLGA